MTIRPLIQAGGCLEGGNCHTVCRLGWHLHAVDFRFVTRADFFGAIPSPVFPSHTQGPTNALFSATADLMTKTSEK